jgi:UDP-glucose:O-linked fucose beta-1,3-glucosyltransferase
MRLGHQDAEASRIQFRDELETLKYSVDRAASDLDSTRAQSKELTREIRDKRKKYDKINIELDSHGAGFTFISQ